MHELRIDKFGWARIATGWRARLLLKQLPRLDEADETVRRGQKVKREHEFSVLTMWLLLPFHGIWFSSKARGFSVSWEGSAGEVLIRMAR
jgi:hypothetical protein